jgi:hypothetical protein
LNPLALLLGADAIAPQTNGLGITVARPSYAAGFVNTPPPPQMPQQGPSKFRNFLGALGDALSVANGGEPYYRQRAQEQQVRGALQGFLTNPDEAISALLKVDPASAITLFRAVHPANEVPAALKEWEAYNALPDDQKPAFIKFRQALNPQILSPVTLGPNDTYDPGTGGASAGAPAAMPHVTDQATYDAVPPGAQYTTPDGKIRTKGGQTVAPSGNFR